MVPPFPSRTPAGAISRTACDHGLGGFSKWESAAHMVGFLPAPTNHCFFPCPKSQGTVQKAVVGGRWLGFCPLNTSHMPVHQFEPPVGGSKDRKLKPRLSRRRIAGLPTLDRGGNLQSSAWLANHFVNRRPSKWSVSFELSTNQSSLHDWIGQKNNKTVGWPATKIVVPKTIVRNITREVRSQAYPQKHQKLSRPISPFPSDSQTTPPPHPQYRL